MATDIIADIEVLKAKLTAQESFTNELLEKNSEAEGSRAIALGRTIGLALQVGEEQKADHYIKLLEALPSTTGATTDAWKGMPSFREFKAAYDRKPEQLTEFACEKEFPLTPGLALSNASGSYAWALDALRRGEETAANPSDLKWAFHASSAVLDYLGFSEQAQALAAKRAEAEQNSWVNTTAEKKIIQR